METAKKNIVTGTPYRMSGGAVVWKPFNENIPLHSPKEEFASISEYVAYHRHKATEGVAKRQSTRIRISLISATKNNEFTSLVKLKGEIIEQREDQIIVKVAVNKERGIYQTRSFDKELFEGKFTKSPGEVIEITILTRPGERRFLFNKITETSPDAEDSVFKDISEEDYNIPLKSF